MGLLVFRHRLDAALDVEFAVDRVEIPAYGAGGEAELVGDLLVGVAGGDELEDLLLARGERISSILRRSQLAEGREHLAGDLAGHRCAAAMGLGDGSDDLRGGRLFEEIAAGSGAQGLEDVVGVVINR